MTATTPALARSRALCLPYELVDVYWHAQTLRCRVRRVATDAKCLSTIGRRFDAALIRVVRGVVEAANGGADKADARLVRAHEALGLAMSYFNDFYLEAGVRDIVVADLRARAMLLLERIEMLKGKPNRTWASTNSLPTVLDKQKEQHSGDAPVEEVVEAVIDDALVVLARVPDAAVRDLPLPVVIAADVNATATWERVDSTLGGERQEE